MTAIEDQVQEELIKTQVESLMSAIDQEKLTTQVDSLKLDGEQQKPPRSPKCVGRCDIELGAITKHNAMQLKRLNNSVFPVNYNDKFYKDILNSGELAKFAYFNDIVVGAVCCRVDLAEEGMKQLYIMTLGTLAPYRSYGVGTMLLNHVFLLCKKDTLIKSIYLHVQINNESAISFYKGFGFEIVGTAEKYYKKIEPDDAFIVSKKINV